MNQSVSIEGSGDYRHSFAVDPVSYDECVLARYCHSMKTDVEGSIILYDEFGPAEMVS